MAKRKSSSTTDKHQAAADKAVRAIGAAITKDDVESMEAGAASNALGQNRRIAMIVCATTGPELRKISLDAPEVFEQMFDSVEQFRNHVKSLADVAEAAFNHLLIAYKDAETGRVVV